jgi:hypothetical protein
MDTPETGDLPQMNDQAIMRGVLPHNGPKRLSRLMSVPVETARCWFYRNLSSSRRRELALRLLAELDEQDRQRAAIREHLERMAGKDVEVGSARGSVAMQEAGGDERRAPARRVGR